LGRGEDLLGLRRYRGTQIDLWQGDPASFYADAHVTLGDAIAKAFVEATGLGVRHVAFTLSSSQSAGLPQDQIAKSLFQALKAYLDTRGQQSPTRVTFIAKDGEEYYLLQSKLFAEFPDELDEDGF
jgi:hypothetical protein